MKRFYRYVSRKRKIRENIGLLLNGAATLLKKNTERPRFSVFYLPQSFWVTLTIRN